MIISDVEILAFAQTGSLVIDPFSEANVQPASYDVTLADTFRRFWKIHEILDPHTEDFNTSTYETKGQNSDGSLILYSQEMVLGSTVEFVEIPAFMVARLEGRSTFARMGIAIHTAGYIDPGFKGHITLEISNHGSRPVVLHPGDRIGQLSFVLLSHPSARPYGHPELGSKYHEQRGPTGAQSDREWKK